CMPLRTALQLCGAYAALVTALGLWLLKTPANALVWAQGSYAVARGYSEAMSLVGPSAQLLAALVCAAGYVGLSLWLRQDESEAFRTTVLLAPALFLAYKHGFVRQDARVDGFFGFAVAAFAIVALQARSVRTAAVSAAGVALSAAIAVAATVPYAT